MIEYLKCINNAGSITSLTIDKFYKYIREDEGHYYIIGDDKILYGFYKTRFIDASREIKIKKILE